MGKGKKKKKASGAASEKQQEKEEEKEEEKETPSQTLPGPSQQKQQEVSKQQQQQQQQKKSKQKEQKVTKDPQQVPQSQSQQVQSSSQPQQEQPQQTAWGPPQQQVPRSQASGAASEQQQEKEEEKETLSQTLPGPSQQKQQEVSKQQQQQQQQKKSKQKKQKVTKDPQQVPQSQPQQVQSSSQPQQEQPQQTARGPPQQQVPQSQPQQAAWGAPRQQAPQSQPQQAAWGAPRQQAPQSQPQQAAWGAPRQQAPQSQPQQAAWGPPRQQAPQSLPQQAAWGAPRQQAPQSQPQQQQQRAAISPQQASIGTAGDHRQAQTVHSDMHRQKPSTSSLEVSKLSLTDPFHSEKMEKAKMSSHQLKSYHEMIPKRADPLKGGSKGQRISVWTNMFQIIFNKNFVTNAVHYDVTIQPFKDPKKEDTVEPKKEVKVIKLPKALCRNIFEQCRNKHFDKRYPAYDGNKNAYSANDLPFNNMQDIFLYENENGRRKQFEIIIKKVANIDLSWIKNLRPGVGGDKDQTAIQVLDIIMRHAPESRFINVGRSLFWDIKENEPLTGGLTLGRGGFMSGILGWQPYLNVDVSHKGFTMTQRVLTYIAEVARVTEENLTYNDVMRNKLKIRGFLKGLKVTYQIPNSSISKRTHRIIDLYEDTCDSHVFQSNDIDYTITKYFREIKKYNIYRTDLPTLHVGRTTTGGKVLLPIELCTIVGGQPINKKLDEMQTTNMIRKAATDAFTRKRRIEEAFNTINVNKSLVMEKEFHLAVSPQMKQVDARILDPPRLNYGGRTTTVAKGIWRLQPFSQAKNLEANSWTILDLSGMPRIDNLIQDFVKMLQDTAKDVGMSIGQPERPFKNFRAYDLRGITEYFNKYKHLKLIIVIIPDRTDVTYGNVKKITEIDVGVLTQCMKVRTVSRANPSTVKNILLKINSKLNGVNHTLSTMPLCLSNYAFMLVGADVTHPAPDSKDVPSIAAVAASSNHSAFQYNVALRLQPPKEEMILDLEAIILSQLNIYYQETKRPPQRIIYYRDGVSEGQLPQVMYYEITAIKNAIRSFNKAQIEVTCLVVQKRHHVRLFPTSSKESDDRNNNVKAGTIVDTTITHPDHIDFYLVSHASIQGTARPTKYRCICNDSKFTEDELEELTYYLCHMYARCTRSVSYPAPTYYAHLAAFRGRALLQGNQNFQLSELEREQRNFKMKMAASPMYFV